MSFTRQRYDTCAYRHTIAESVGTLDWVLDPVRFENNNKCRMAFGVPGGTAVSHIKGNIVDLESDLYGITRLSTKCPTLDYQNPCPAGDMNSCRPGNIVIRSTPTTVGRVIDTTPMHLRECQMFRYQPIPLPPAIVRPSCRM
jgi:hypothetical protein